MATCVVLRILLPLVWLVDVGVPSCVYRRDGRIETDRQKHRDKQRQIPTETERETKTDRDKDRERQRQIYKQR